MKLLLDEELDMYKRITAILTALAASVCVVPPAMAAENILAQTGAQAVQIAALGTGLAIGIPVASVRSMAKSIGDVHEGMTEVLAGNTASDAPASAITFLPAIPIGTVTSIVRGVGRGWENATNNYKEKPFSAESLSLDNLQQ
jgi:hypothetical protein